MLKEFRDFIIRGNALDLAIGVVLGAAFGAVITSLVNDIVMQVVAAIIGQPNFSSITIPLGRSEIKIGAFLNTIINLSLIGLSLFLVVKVINRIRQSHVAQQEASEAAEIVLLREIRDALKAR